VGCPSRGKVAVHRDAGLGKAAIEKGRNRWRNTRGASNTERQRVREEKRKSPRQIWEGIPELHWIKNRDSRGAWRLIWAGSGPDREITKQKPKPFYSNPSRASDAQVQTNPSMGARRRIKPKGDGRWGGSKKRRPNGEQSGARGDSRHIHQK